MNFEFDGQYPARASEQKIAAIEKLTGKLVGITGATILLWNEEIPDRLPETLTAEFDQNDVHVEITVRFTCRHDDV